MQERLSGEGGRIILAMYAKQPDETDVRPALAYWGVLVICMIGGIVLGVVPGVLMDVIL